MNKLYMFAVLALLVAGNVWAQAVPMASIEGLRGPTPLAQEPNQAPMPKEVNDDKKRTRSYPEQPPIIPHQIRDYQVDLNANKCLTCHARKATEITQATTISITHYMDRDGQFLATISPRRYFCNQCHVGQDEVTPPVASTFEDIDTVLERAAQKKQ